VGVVKQREDSAQFPGAAAPQPLWRNRDFLLIWIGGAISSLGSQASQLALPLLVLAVTGSPAKAGFLGAIRGASYLLFGLPAGALIDRWNRRAVMVIADGLRALAFASIPLALVVGRLTAVQLYAVSCIEGVGFIAHGLADTASTPRIVPKAQIPAALAQAQVLESISRTIGPTFGGALFAISRALPFVADALSYAVSIVAILAVRTPLAAERAAQAPHLGREIAAGLAWLRGQRTLFTITWVHGAVNFVYGGYPLLIIALAQRLGAGSSAIGLVFTLGGVGTLIGAALAPVILRRFAVGRVILATVWPFTLVWVPYALAPTPLALGLTLLVGLLMAGIYSGAIVAYRLVRTPDAMQGRVIGVGRLLTFGGESLGYLLMGLLIQRFGAVATALIMLPPAILLAAITTLSPGVRRAPRVADSSYREAGD
jgi:MFS family permease